MSRHILVLAVILILGPCSVRAQPYSVRAQTTDSPTEEKGTYLGVLFSPVPELLYDQLPALSRGCGVVVTHVLPESPAAQADLRRHDLLLQYEGKKIEDCEHFARLIRDDKPDRKVKLVLLRAGREMSAEVTLARGPILRIAQDKLAEPKGLATTAARSSAKGSGPASVNVTATPLTNGNLKVVIDYYEESTGRWKPVTCTGTAADIEKEFQKLPPRVQPLARVALERMEKLAILHKATDKEIAPKSSNP